MKRISNIILLSALVWGGLYLSLGNKSGPVVDPRLEFYVNEWKAVMDAAGIHYEGGYNRIRVIDIAELGGAKAGKSIKGSSVIIDTDEYNRGGCTLKFIVFHELGHNVFNLNHEDDHCNMMEPNVYIEEECDSRWNKLKIDYLKKCRKNEWEAR